MVLSQKEAKKSVEDALAEEEKLLYTRGVIDK